MKHFTLRLLVLLVVVGSLTALTSFVLLKNTEATSMGPAIEMNRECGESLSTPLTSNGDFLAFYTTLSTASPPIPLTIDVVSFPSMNGAATTLSSAWNSYNFTQGGAFLPTNTTAYDPFMKELIYFISGELQYLHYKDNSMTGNMGTMMFPESAPVYFNGNYYSILVEDGGYGTPPVLEADIDIFNTTFGNFSSVMHVQTTTPNLFNNFTHESMSSATNGVDEMYFLSGTNLVIVTDLNIFNLQYCWIDLEPANSSNNFHIFYGVEYKSPGVLLAIRETFINNMPHTDLVEITFNSTNCTVSSIVSVYDLQSNIPIAPGGWLINYEYYSTTYDSCHASYYISSKFNSVTSSRLIEINIPNSSYVEQIFPKYLFGLEWKHNPCPCEANFAIQQFAGCGRLNFVNTSSGSASMSCQWDFGDPNSGINNTSNQCFETHQFSSCGTYNVCLTITANGCMEAKCQPITVTDVTPPVALCKNNVVLTLNANCVANVSPTDIDAGSFDDCSLSLYDVTPNSFSQCGTFPVTLTVTDWCGNTSTCNTVVQVVDNILPVITPPADVYLTTISSNCMIVANGLQWLTLSDNCGVSIVSYTVTGASNYVGFGDASGLNFNQGISTITYIATDQCGNSNSCSFQITIDCLCTCPGNLLQNGGFTSGTTVGDMAQNGSTNFWNLATESPQISGSDFCCDANSIQMWGRTYNGESIYQSNVPILGGHHYKISFCGKYLALNPNAGYAQFGFTGGPIPTSGTFNPYNCTNCENAGSSSNISSTSWNSYALAIWTPTQNWDRLYVRVFRNSNIQTWGRIDNICLEEVQYRCCEDEQEFIENTDNALNSYPDQETWEGVLDIGNLMECNTVEYVDWGDGHITIGPLPFNSSQRHKYDETGSYEVKCQVREFDPQDTSHAACFEHIFNNDIVILPDTCFCGVFSNMELSWGTEYSQQVACGNDSVSLSCPPVGSGFDFTGSFYCNGTICPRDSPLTWTLSGPGGNQSGTTSANPYFGISILPSYVTQPGVYTLILYGQCGNQVCDCIIHFIVDCPDLCPCNPADILAFGNAVDMGFSHALQSNSCQVCFSPNAISNCETVEWHLNTFPNLLGTSVGTQSFCHTFPSSGSYDIIMVVNRKNSNGGDCETFTFSRQVNVSCQSLPDCNDPRIVNPNFNLDAAAGGLNSEGNSTGWKGVAGNPVVVADVQGSPDGWAVRLSGNHDYTDELQSEGFICLDPMGVISLRIRIDPFTGKILPCDKIMVDFISGTLAKRLATFPLSEIDSSNWWEIKIPFDVSDWIGLDTCNGNLASVSAHLRLSVSNALRNELGGSLTYTELLIDNVCLDNLVYTSAPIPVFPVKITPNPNNGEFVIELPQAANQKTTLQIISMTGQLLFEKKAESGTDLQLIEVRHLPSGIYFLQIVQDGRVMSVDKFVKM